jgi:hypothetical protein
MLPMLVYLMYLGGDPEPLANAAPHLAEVGAVKVPLLGHATYIDRVMPQLWAWMEKQIRRLEQTSFGETRPEVANYLQGFIHRAGSHRTVGAETGATAVADR